MTFESISLLQKSIEMKPVSVLLLLLAWRLSGANAQSYNLISSETSDVPLTEPVQYSCMFKNLWTRAHHPVAYPSFAHWSPIVLVAHSQEYTMWREGQIASPGVENVAETGSTRAILSEINAAGGSTNPVVIGPLIFTQNSEREVKLPDVQVDESHPFLSTITMIAPSPDWFSGFHYFDARDVSANAWYQEFEVETLPWDAGTADDNFASVDATIFEYSIDRLPSNGAFASDDGSTVLPVARWTCTLQAPPAPSVARFVSTSVSTSFSSPASPYNTKPSDEPSVAPSVSPSASTKLSGVPTVCVGESEQCSTHADCCGDGVCFQTCLFRRVPGDAAVSKDQFIIGPVVTSTSRLRGGSSRRNLLKGS